LTIYFDEIPKDKDICFNIKAKRAFPILDLKPALIKMYSYYRREEEEVAIEYSI